jgi:hypothetical protein
MKIADANVHKRSTTCTQEAWRASSTGHDGVAHASTAMHLNATRHAAQTDESSFHMFGNFADHPHAHAHMTSCGNEHGSHNTILAANKVNLLLSAGKCRMATCSLVADRSVADHASSQRPSTYRPLRSVLAQALVSAEKRSTS